MSAVLTRRRVSRAGDREAARAAARQESLFGGVMTTGAPSAAAAVPPPVTGQTLDQAMSSLWAGLVAGELAVCPACGSPELRPRHSAGAGVVGGRCGGCGTTLG